jgi:hypothetical protein
MGAAQFTVTTLRYRDQRERKKKMDWERLCDFVADFDWTDVEDFSGYAGVMRHIQNLPLGDTFIIDEGKMNIITVERNW